MCFAVFRSLHLLHFFIFQLCSIACVFPGHGPGLGPGSFFLFVFVHEADFYWINARCLEWRGAAERRKHKLDFSLGLPQGSGTPGRGAKGRHRAKRGDKKICFQPAAGER